MFICWNGLIAVSYVNSWCSRQNNFELIVSLKNNRASGKLFWDDGESINSIENGQYQINTFDFANVIIYIGLNLLGGIELNVFVNCLVECTDIDRRQRNTELDGHCTETGPD